MLLERKERSQLCVVCVCVCGSEALRTLKMLSLHSLVFKGIPVHNDYCAITMLTVNCTNACHFRIAKYNTNIKSIRLEVQVGVN